MGATQRRVAACAAAAAGVGFLSSVLWDLVRLDDGPLVGDTAALVQFGGNKARLFQLAMIADMWGSYLLFGPLVVFLWFRLRDRNPFAAAVGSCAGIAYALNGAVGAAVLAVAGSSLMRAYGDDPSTAVATSFTVLTDAVLGMWQVVGGLLLGTWLITVGLLLRDEWRRFAWATMAFGAITALAAVGASVATANESAIPATLLFSPLAMWPAALAVMLWRDASRDAVTL